VPSAGDAAGVDLEAHDLAARRWRLESNRADRSRYNASKELTR
jgi:hypothetical protein